MAVGISVLALHRKALQRVVGGGKHDGRRLPVPEAGLLDRSLGGGQRGWADGGEELGPRALQAHRVGGEEALASGLWSVVEVRHSRDPFSDVATLFGRTAGLKQMRGSEESQVHCSTLPESLCRLDQFPRSSRQNRPLAYAFR